MRIIASSAICLCLFTTSSAFGAFGVTVSGDATQIAQPSSALPGDVVGDTLYIWYEGIATASGQTVNHNGSDTGTPISGLTPNPNGVTSAGNTPGTISGDLRSYVIHYDNNGNAAAVFDFDQVIKGMAYEINTLTATDGVFGAGTDYWNLPSEGGDGQPDNRGLELNDSISISNGGKRLTVNIINANGAALDNIRVFTAVPELTTILGWATLAGIGCIFYRHYR